MVTRIEPCKKMIGMLRVAHNTVKIDHCIEVPGRPYPRIHRLPVGFAQRAGMVIVLTLCRA